MGRTPQESRVIEPYHSYSPAKRTELGQLIMHFRNQMYCATDVPELKTEEVLDMYHPAEATLAGSENPENYHKDSYG